MKRDYGVWVIAGIIVIVAIAFFIKQQGILLSPKLGGPGATTGEDICPNPKDSYTACIGETKCTCSDEKGDYSFWTAPSGKTCGETALTNCKKDTIRTVWTITDLALACTTAREAAESPGPGECSTGCSSSGFVNHESKTSTCCTATVERNCVPKAGGIATQ